MIPQKFFDQNQLGNDLERNEEILQTPLPAGFTSPNQNYADLNLHPTYPLHILIASGKAIKNLEVQSLSAEIEGKTSSVTFELTHPVTFRSRDLVFVFTSKLQLITRATILSVTKNTLKILPENDFDENGHFVLTKAGSEITSLRNTKSLSLLNDECFHSQIFTDTIKYASISDKLLEFPSLNSSQTSAASKLAQIKENQLLVIQGPPGTGKTTTLAQGIKEYRRLNPSHKILITAPSNTAVDNLLLKTTGLRLGSAARASPEIEEYLLENVILKAKKQELKDLQKDVLECQKNLSKSKKSMSKTGEKTDFINSRNSLRSANKTLYQAMKSFKFEVLEQNKIIACTLSYAASIREKFDLVVVDEAGQSLNINLAAAIITCKGGLVLCGDPSQLSPTILSDQAKNLKLFSQTSMKKLCKMDNKPFDYSLLDTSYRFGPQICEFPSKQFYQGKLKTAQNVPVENDIIDADNVVFVDTAGLDFYEEKGEGIMDGSLRNVEEGRVVVNILMQILEKTKPENIGIIAPYSAQVAFLRENSDETGVEIHTIDGFQGREKDVIIMSMTRSNEEKEIGFLDDFRRLNVSITRAKQQLIIIGDSQTLEGGKTLSKWIEWIMDNCTVICAQEFE